MRSLFPIKFVAIKISRSGIEIFVRIRFIREIRDVFFPVSLLPTSARVHR